MSQVEKVNKLLENLPVNRSFVILWPLVDDFGLRAFLETDEPKNMVRFDKEERQAHLPQLIECIVVVIFVVRLPVRIAKHSQ